MMSEEEALTFPSPRFRLFNIYIPLFKLPRNNPYHIPGDYE